MGIVGVEEGDPPHPGTLGGPKGQAGGHGGGPEGLEEGAAFHGASRI